MCNLARVEENNLVYDPFCGSGSLIIPPAHFKAICVGSDLDSRVIHGTGVGKINQLSTFYKDESNKTIIEETKPKIMLNFI